MKLLKITLRFIRRGLFCILLTYEAIFIFGSIITLKFGGPHGVISWYHHVFDTPYIDGKCVGDTCPFESDPSWLGRLGSARFWGVQLSYGIVTVLLGFPEWRSRKRKHGGIEKGKWASRLGI